MFPNPARKSAEATRVLGEMLRDVLKLNDPFHNFRIFGPDETASNRLNAVFEVTDRESTAKIFPYDDHISPDGRVMEVLERAHVPGLARRLPAHRPPRLFLLLRSLHSHRRFDVQPARQMAEGLPQHSLAAADRVAQLPAHVARLASGSQRIQPSGPRLHRSRRQQEGGRGARLSSSGYANCLLSVADHCLRSRNYVNVIVAGKQPALQYLDMDAAIKHCTAGVGIWDWASNDQGVEPDVVMACCGDVPTLETLAAVDLLRKLVPDLKIRVVNVVDLMTLQPSSEHPHGLSDRDFDAIFTADKPIVFAFHGYPWLIHRLTYRRTNHDNLHVRGYKEEGTTTTPFDMTVINDLDRFHLAGDAIDRVPRLRSLAGYPKQLLRDRLDRAQTVRPAHRRRHARDQELEMAGGMKILVLNVGSSTLQMLVSGCSQRAHLDRAHGMGGFRKAGRTALAPWFNLVAGRKESHRFAL